MPLGSRALTGEDPFILLRVMLLSQTAPRAILTRFQLERTVLIQPDELLIGIARLTIHGTNGFLLIRSRDRQAEVLVAIGTDGLADCHELLPRRRTAPIYVDARAVATVAAAFHTP